MQLLLKISDFTGRIAKWGTRLNSCDIRYKPRNLVKGQVLAEFIIEFSLSREMDSLSRRSLLVEGICGRCI